MESVTDEVRRTEDLDGQPVSWNEVEPTDGSVPTIYLHGVPMNGDLWAAFLERTGGLAPDLPGFGRTTKRGDNAYTIEGYAAWLERFLAWRGVDRFNLVVHGWGAVGLALAMRSPERVERLVVINGVPFLPGYRWHPVARLWRTRGLGEIGVGLLTRFTVKHLTRRAKATPGPMPAEFLDIATDHIDQGTQRAILQLYRSSSPERLAAAGTDLGAIDCPALVLWGQEDPYVPARFGPAYTDALAAAEHVPIPGAGHWPWYDRPDVIDIVADFLLADA